jgi:hemoglobin
MTGDFSSAAERRAALTAQIQAATGIDEPMIERLIRAFYARVRQDPLIGPVFAARITDWEPHLARMCDFWSSVALMSGRYHGQPMNMHLPLPIDARHFDRWLMLFETTAREQCTPEAAEHFIKLARRVGESLELGIAGAHGVMLGKGERFIAD